MSFTIDPDENLVQVTTPRPMRSIVVCLAIVIGLAGCVSKYKTDTFTGAEVQLSSEGGFYVMLTPHGTYGSKVYMNSGRETTQAVAAALSHHVEICAAANGAKYVGGYRDGKPYGQRVPDVHHHREVDDLRGTVEITKRIFHSQSLRTGPIGLKPV